jgi:hypothetical protein
MKKMQPAFLPHNYLQIMYQRLQNWSQGAKSVDEYTEEFHKLLARVDISESDKQLVSRYIGGLRIQIQDTVNPFDPMNISSAYTKGLCWLRKRWHGVPWACLDVEEWGATTGWEVHSKTGDLPHQTVQTKGSPLQGSLVEPERLPVSSVSDAVNWVIG